MIERVALPPFGKEVSVESGEFKTHDPSQCFNDDACVIHKPSNHHMREWPITIRMDRFGCLAERRCPHGTGHPDPDSLAYVESLHEPKDRGYEGIHGCDGCCKSPVEVNKRSI